MSMVLSYTNEKFYHYSKAVTYSTYLYTELPVTSNIFKNTCKSIDFTPNHAHVILYPDGESYIDWHNDNPIKKGSPVLVLRLGCPRIISLRKSKLPRTLVKFVIYEGDAWVMSWEAQQEWEHALLPMNKKKLKN